MFKLKQNISLLFFSALTLSPCFSLAEGYIQPKGVFLHKLPLPANTQDIVKAATPRGEATIETAAQIVSGFPEVVQKFDVKTCADFFNTVGKYYKIDSSSTALYTHCFNQSIIEANSNDCKTIVQYARGYDDPEIPAAICMRTLIRFATLNPFAVDMKTANAACLQFAADGSAGNSEPFEILNCGYSIYDTTQNWCNSVTQKQQFLNLPICERNRAESATTQLQSQ